MLFQVELRLKNLWFFIWIQPIFFFKNSFVLWLNNTKHSFKVVTQLALLSTVSKRSIHFADSFLLLKWSFKIEVTEPWDMPMASIISGTFNLRPRIYGFSKCFRCIELNWISTTFGFTRACATVRQNSINQYFIIEIDGTVSPYYFEIFPNTWSRMWQCSIVLKPHSTFNPYGLSLWRKIH